MGDCGYGEVVHKFLLLSRLHSLADLMLIDRVLVCPGHSIVRRNKGVLHEFDQYIVDKVIPACVVHCHLHPDRLSLEAHVS